MAFDYIWEEITAEQLDERFLDIQTVELIREWQINLRELIQEKIGRNVFLEPLEISRGYKTLNVLEIIRNIEENIKNLAATDIISGMQPTVFWRGDLLDVRRLDFNDVNRWFRTMYLLYLFAQHIKPYELITGTFHTGDELDLQSLGVF